MQALFNCQVFLSVQENVIKEFVTCGKVMKRIFDEEIGVLPGYNSMSVQQIPCQPQISTVFRGGGNWTHFDIVISGMIYSLNIQTVHVVNRRHFSDFSVLNPTIKPGYDLIHVVKPIHLIKKLYFYFFQCTFCVICKQKDTSLKSRL